MKQLIRKILKEEINQIKRFNKFVIESRVKENPKGDEYKKYKSILDSIVYQVVSEDEICGYGAEYFLNGGEEAVRIVLYYKDGKYPGYEIHRVYAENIKAMVENYLPIVSMAFVPFDSTKCKQRVSENVDVIQKNIKIINLLLSEISWDGLCDIWVEYNKDDGEYEIRSKTTNRNRGFDEELSFLDRTLSSMGLRVFIFAPWFVDSCEDEVKFFNESKEETNYLPIIEKLVKPFKEDECICNVDLWYDDEDDMYSVYLVFGTEELNDKFTSDGKFVYVRKKQKEVEETIKSYLPIKNIRVGSYGTPHCGWKSLNE